VDEHRQAATQHWLRQQLYSRLHCNSLSSDAL